MALMVILHRQFFCKEIQCSGTGVRTWSFPAVIMHSKIHNTVEEWEVTVACYNLNGVIKNYDPCESFELIFLCRSIILTYCQSESACEWN